MAGTGATALWGADQEVALTSTPREVPERGKVLGATVQTGKDRDSFIVPAGWRMGLAKTEGKVILQSSEYSGTMEIRSLPRTERAPTCAEFREQVLAVSERSQVQREYTWPGTNTQTFVFDTNDANQKQLAMRRRVLFMVLADRVMEVSLTARADRFDDCQRAFEIVVASLRSE